MKHPTEGLNELLTRARAAVLVYVAASDRVSIDQLVDQLTAFRIDHERHVSDLTSQVLREGGVPRNRPDLAGALWQGVTAVRSWGGASSVLGAVRFAEVRTLESHLEVLSGTLSAEGRDVVRIQVADLIRHIDWIDRALREGWFGAQEREVHV